MTSSSPLRITVFVAGTNNPSNCDTLADAFIDGMRAEHNNILVEKILIRDLDLKHFDLSCYNMESDEIEQDCVRIEKAVMESDGLVFASPIWNFSVPAHFKNLLDRMGAFALDSQTHSKGQLHGKPFSLIYTGGAPLIAWKALMYLTTLHVAEALKYYGGTVVQRHFEPRCTVGKGQFGLVVDKRPDSLKFMNKQGGNFANIALHFKEKGTLPSRQAMWQKWFEFLYRVGNRIMYPLSGRQ